MSSPSPEIAVVGATGPIGITLAREMLARGRRVRVIARSTDRLDRAFAGLDVERVAADALDPDRLRDAVSGAAVVVDSIGLPPDRMDDHARTARHIARAAAATGARGLQVSSFWSYLPTRRLPIDELHPRSGGNSYMTARRAAEDELQAAGFAVVHLPDFFGPEVHTSTVQNALFEAASGRPMSWVGAAGVERDAGFVPDLARRIADLIEHDEAWGERWAVAGSGPLSGVRLARIASSHLGREVKLRAAPPWLLRFVSLVSRDLRAIMPMVPHYATAVSYDDTKLSALLGPARPTPYEEAVPAALDWITSRAAAV